MREFQVKSKVYKQQKKNKFLIVIVSICVIITSLLGIISIINDGVKVGNVSPIIMALVIGMGVYEKSKESAFYQFDIAAITIGEKLIINYQTSKLQIMFDIREIFSLKYSDQLQCLQVVGNYERTDDKNKERLTNNEYLLYVGDGEEVELISELEAKTNLQVQYMDR